MESPKRILGLEGGGTKTNWVLLAEDGSVLREGVLPASNLRLITDKALNHLLSVLPREATHVGAFLAGCATEEDRARLRGLVEKTWPNAQIAIGSDRDSGLATAFRDGDGIAVIAGTGTAVHGRKGGRIEKAGGWGHLLGDRGGGYDLARRGLRLVLTHFDLNQQITPLAEEIMQTLGLNRLQDLVGWAMQADKMSVARLAPAIFHAAKTGEPQMLATVQAGADLLAQFTWAVAERLDFPAAPVRLLGGLFAHHADYVSLYKYQLSILLPKAEVEVCAESGAIGAAWLAERGEGAGEPRIKSQEPIALARDSVVVADAGALAVASTEQNNPRSAALEEQTTTELVELFVTEESKVAEALAARRAELVAAVDLVSAALRAGGRLFYVGAGTSGRLGVLDASEIPPTFGAPPELVQGIIAGGAPALHRAVEGAEDQPEAGALAVLDRGVRAGDVVCGITASGRAPFVLGALARARELGARTVLLTCNAARVATEWDVEIDLPTGPEIVTGSTRLKAGTATKVVLNLLSTCAMIRLGRVRGNSMVDLHISNAKLRDRGVRLVSQELQISYEEARQRLEKADWNVRAALGYRFGGGMHISNSYYLIVDLEATCSEDGAVPRDEMEIIEIGAVMLSSRSFEMESKFQSFVSPVRHPQLTPFCTELTKITQKDLAAAPLFTEAIEALKKWMDAYDDALFCSWGDYDRKQFWQDCQYHDVAFPFRSGHLNLKEEFSRTMGRQKKLGIGQALKNLGLRFEGSPHRGLDDARNIARLVRHVCVGA